MDNLVRINRVIEITGMPRTSIYEKILDRTFPAQIKIGSRTVAWPESEIYAVNAARIAGRTDAQIRELVQTLAAKRKNADTPPAGEVPDPRPGMKRRLEVAAGGARHV
jgi:prophage regulatory protein